MKRRLGSTVSGAACAFAISLAPLPVVASPFSIRLEAPAEDAMAQAEAQWEQGSDAYALGNYESAVKHFERSYELSQEGALLFDIGQSYVRWHDVSENPEHLRKARNLYENYLTYLQQMEKEDPKGAEAARADTQARIAAVDEQLAQLESGQETTSSDDRKPVYKRGWFWGTIIGVVVVAAGVATTVVLVQRKRNQDEFDPELGTIGDGRSFGPVFRF